MYEYFTAVPRVPQWNNAFSMKLEQRWFRYFTWHADFGNKEHLHDISAMLASLSLWDRANQIKCYSTLEKMEVLPFIEAFCAGRPDNAAGPDYIDLYYLYSHILETRPKVVLELGSGISTAVIAAALRHNGEGRLYAVDPQQNWAESTAQCLPGELKDWCEVTWSDAEPVRVAGGDSSKFKVLPVEHADMIYLDAAHQSAVFRGAETVHALRPSFKGGETILIDGRWWAIEFFGNRPKFYHVMSYGNVVVTKGPKGAFGGMDIYSNTIVTVRPPAHA